MSRSGALDRARFEETATLTAAGMPVMHTYRLIAHDVRHFHRAMELGICTEGEGVSETGGLSQRFSVGDLQVVFPFQPHRNVSDAGKSCMWKWVFVDPFEIARKTGNNVMIFSQLMKKISVYGIIPPKRNPAVTYCLNELMNAVAAEDDYCMEKVYSLLVVLMIALTAEKSDAPPVSLPERFETVVSLMSTVSRRLTEGAQVTVNELCEECRVPVSTCRRLFQNALGTPPKRYIQTCAVQAAKVYLAQTGLSVTEAAERTGFSDLSTFNRTFKALTGVSPSEYRREAADFT